jgi:hypothetical protein
MERFRIETGDGVTPSLSLTCFVNPKDYSIKRSNTWTSNNKAGKVPYPPQFGSGGAVTISVALTLLADADGSGSVTDQVAVLMKMMEPTAAGAKKKASPPHLQLRWGNDPLFFEVVMTNASVQFTYFQPDGVPVRATATIELLQATKWDIKGAGSWKPAEKGQNPTTRGTAGLRSHLVRDGDTLAGLSYLYLDDPTRWRLIADANGIDDPLRLRRGQVLAIPPLP